jgi:hypothetical protein
MDRQDRERVVRTIRELEVVARELRERREPIDPTELVHGAQARCGVDPSKYDLALAEDHDLVILEETALREAVSDAGDPGPYDCISREASSGKPGDHSATAHLNVIRR